MGIAWGTATIVVIVAGAIAATTGCQRRPQRPAPFDTMSGRAVAGWGSVVGGSVTGNNTMFPQDVLLPVQRVTPPFNTEAYEAITDNAFLAVERDPLSTFAIDVDTASYSNVRRLIGSGIQPPRDAVRIEELVNYFAYDYAPPSPEDRRPFAVHFESAAAPWDPAHRLVRIGIKGREIAPAQRPPANLVFLLDVSGSMNEPRKLPLVKRSLRLLVEQLNGDDHVAIVVYAGASGLALPWTSCANREVIVDAIERLQPGGSTNGAAGIQLAYDVAAAHFLRGGINRVLLATDGDFNVGITSEGDLGRLIRSQAARGIFLTTLGFGYGNLKDATLEQLADRGNGAYAYVDTLQEARRIFVEQATSTLLTIAKDVKIQVEFNPARVRAYRLIGYENRLLEAEDFNNDRIDAGDIGAGHTVTALYEIVPAGVEWRPESTIDPLKYRALAPAEIQTVPVGGVAHEDELLTVKIRHKAPDADGSEVAEYVLLDTGAAFAEASADFRFAAAVAGFGMLLRDSPFKGSTTWSDVSAWAASARTSSGRNDPYRQEFLELVRQAQGVAQQVAAVEMRQ